MINEGNVTKDLIYYFAKDGTRNVFPYCKTLNIRFINNKIETRDVFLIILEILWRYKCYLRFK